MSKRVDINGLEKLLDGWQESCDCDFPCSCDNIEKYAAASAIRKFIVDDGVKMITAAEAKKRVDEKIEGEASEWLKKAETAIEAAILKKSKFVYLPYKNDIFDFCKKELQKYGYKIIVDSGSFGQSSEVKVSWE